MTLPTGNSEFATSAVPAEFAIFSSWQIAVVKIGVILALPAFITGAQIGFSMGLARGALAMFIGSAVLGTLAFVTGTIGARSRQSTALILRYAFGTRGARFVSGLIGVTLIGFFAVTAELFGEGVARLARGLAGRDLAAAPFIVGGGLLMILTSVFGFRGLRRLADVALPVKFIGLLWIFAIAWRDHGPAALAQAPTTAVPLSVGISAVIGGVAVGATVFPDLARFARDAGHARRAGIGSFAIAFPVILLLAAVPSVVTQQRDLVEIMVMMGLGFAAFAFLVFAAWTTNTSNLYSASLGLANLFRGARYPALATAAGTAGIALALTGVTDQLIPYLVVLGIAIPPVAGIYIADFYLVRGRCYDLLAVESLPAVSWRAFAAWGVGIGVALAASQGLLAVTGVPACDSIVIAFLSYWLLSRLLGRHRAAVRTQPLESR